MSELRPAEVIGRYSCFGELRPATLEFFLESCEDLVSYSIEELWVHFRSQGDAKFCALLKFRDYLLSKVSKPKIQFIRDELERIGVSPRPINLDDIENHPPIFSVSRKLAHHLLGR